MDQTTVLYSLSVTAPTVFQPLGLFFASRGPDPGLLWLLHRAASWWEPLVAERGGNGTIRVWADFRLVEL